MASYTLRQRALVAKLTVVQIEAGAAILRYAEYSDPLDDADRTYREIRVTPGMELTISFPVNIEVKEK